MIENGMVKYLKGFLEKHGKKSDKTRANYLADLNQLAREHFGLSDIYEVTMFDMETLVLDNLLDYFSKLYNKKDDKGKRLYRNSSIERKQSTVKSFLKYLVAREAIEYNLTKLTELDDLSDDSEEIEMIPLEIALSYADYAVDRERNGLMKSLLIKTALETAMRIGELLDLEWSQFVVEYDGVAIKSKGENRGKGNKEYLDKISFEFYKNLLKLKNNDSEKVFQIKYRTVAKMMVRLNQVFGNVGKGYSFHSLKKTAVTEVYIETRCILAAQRKARHKSINTTRRYLRVVETPITGVISRLLTTQQEAYKDVNREILLNCIELLPRDMRVLLNRHVNEYIKNTETLSQVI